MAKITQFVFLKRLSGCLTALLISSSLFVFSLPVIAQSTTATEGQQERQKAAQENKAKAAQENECTGSECLGTNPDFGNDCDANKSSSKCLKDQTFIKNVVQPVVDFLSALVGVVVVGVLVLGGLQYITGGDKPEALAKAKKHITNGLVALLIYILLFSFIQYLIPGGIFG